jgi:formylglycine-generating enzyme
MTAATRREATTSFVISSRVDVRSSTTAAGSRAARRRPARRQWAWEERLRRGAALVGAGLLLGGCGRINLGSRQIDDSEPPDGAQHPSPSSPGDIPPSSPSGIAPGASTISPPVGSLAPPAITVDGGPAHGLENEDCSDAASDAGLLPPVLDPTPPSCRGATEFCGPSSDSCCLTLPVDGATVALPLDSQTRAAVTVSSYHLDKYEVTVGRFRAFLAAYDDWRALGNPQLGAGSHPRAAGSGWQQDYEQYLPESAAELERLVRECNTIPLSTLDLPNTSSRIPLNCINWIEASSFCAWDGARLPTFPEWYDAAAGGALDRIYPWGDEPTPSRLYASYGCTLGLERPECNAAYVLPVGSHTNGAGLFGQEDLAGSMTEWLLGGSLDPFAPGCSDCVGLTSGPNRFWKGGSWVDTPSSLENTYFVIADQTLRLPFLGLRCARDSPELESETLPG